MFSQRWNGLELEDPVKSPFSSLKLWTKRILASEFFFFKLPKAYCPRQSCSPFSQVFHLQPFNQLIDRSWINTSLAFYIPGLVSWVKVVSSWVFIHSITHSKLSWHKTDGHRALLLQAIQKWLPLPTQVMRKNRKLERDIQKLKNETQQSMSRASKKTINSSDIFIKRSIYVNITIGS